MKLYANVKSERAQNGQGGNEFLEIEITNGERRKIALIRVTCSDKILISAEYDKDSTDFKICDTNKICTCVDPLCAKCLLVNCEDNNCKVHPESKKREFREMYKNRN